jgi:hypothetical protein
MNIQDDKVLYFYVVRGSEVGSDAVEKWSGTWLREPLRTVEQVSEILEEICEEDGLDLARCGFVALNRL